MFLAMGAIGPAGQLEELGSSVPRISPLQPTLPEQTAAQLGEAL